MQWKVLPAFNAGLNAVAHDFAGCFVFPGASLLQRPIEGNGSPLPAIVWKPVEAIEKGSTASG